MFLLYLAQVIRNNSGVQEQRQTCTNIVYIITLVLLSPRTSDMATAEAMTHVLDQLLTFADAMSSVKGLHELATFEDAMSPVKGLHKIVTLVFISVTFLCF